MCLVIEVEIETTGYIIKIVSLIASQSQMTVI